MTFIGYVRDKFYFFVFYVALMLFVSLIMLAGAGGSGKEQAVDNVIYANVGGLTLAALYVVCGFCHRRAFRRGLDAAVAEGRTDGDIVWPEPQNDGQRLYLELLGRMHADQARQRQRLQHDLRDHRDFILSWIHEVKLPIAAGRLLIENRMGKSADRLADRLEDELDKIDGYVEQALYYSRIDSFSRDYFIAETPLEAIVKASLKKYAKLFIAKRIRPDFAGVGHSVHSDGKWLAYIVNQLVANALTYTESGGTVSFRTEEDGDEKRLIVADTGIGIEAADLPRVFDKGFTGANGRRSQAKSTGMGLYLARMLARKLGHELSIASGSGSVSGAGSDQAASGGAGGGTAVTIHFPKDGGFDFRKL